MIKGVCNPFLLFLSAHILTYNEGKHNINAKDTRFPTCQRNQEPWRGIRGLNDQLYGGNQFPRRIITTDLVRSNRTTLVKGPLYKEASSNGKLSLTAPTLPATRSHHARGIDLDLILQILLHQHSHIPPLVIVDFGSIWRHCKTIFYQSYDLLYNVYDCWFHLYVWVILLGLRDSA